MNRNDYPQKYITVLFGGEQGLRERKEMLKRLFRVDKDISPDETTLALTSWALLWWAPKEVPEWVATDLARVKSFCGRNSEAMADNMACWIFGVRDLIQFSHSLAKMVYISWLGEAALNIHTGSCSTMLMWFV
jgi:hypothetical protein